MTSDDNLVASDGNGKAVPPSRYDQMCEARRQFAVAFIVWLQESRPGYYEAMEESTGTGQQLRQLTALMLDGTVA